MAQYLKRGKPRSRERTQEIRTRVTQMLEEIEVAGERAVRQYSRELDDWAPPSFRIADDVIDETVTKVDPSLREHIQFAADQVRRFAEAQLATLLPLEIEMDPGTVLGHRHVPVGAVGAYIPGGRYPLISSALMSILTAKVAGVRRVVAMTAPSRGIGIHPPTLYAMHLAGADEIYALGGVQAMGAMAFGALQELEPVDMLVGAGNAYVAEAKRQLFGLVGIDLLAGPTEVLIIADESARARTVAIDLLAQAEHGPTSLAVLVALSQRLGQEVLDEVRALLQSWPTRETAQQAWEDLGTVVVAGGPNEAIALADEFAPEHLQLQVSQLQEFESRLQNYGSLFVGEESTVVFGDKAVGTNHTLPTQRAARYTGGLWVGKYLKTLTYERLTPAASRRVAIPSAAISRAENLIGHAISAEARLENS